MRIDVVFSAKEVNEQVVKGKVVVVIDVLRATTVMVTAVQNGVDKVVPVLSPEEAFEIRKAEKVGKVLLGGERGAMPIEGFDYGNSPLDYTPEVVKGKTLVMTTSNGTRAIKGAEECDEMFIGSFINAQAVINRLQKDKDVVFVCSGSKDVFTLEDSLCAGLLISRLVRKFDVILTDAAISMKILYELNEKKLFEFSANGHHFQLLKKKGFDKDLEYCFTIDLLNVVPEYRKGEIRIF